MWRNYAFSMGNWSDYEYVKNKVLENGFNLKFASENLKHDTNIITHALKNNGRALIYVPDKLRNNKEFILIAIAQDGESIAYMPSIYRDSYKIAYMAVTSNGNSLRYFSEKLRADKTIAIIAIKNFPYSIDSTINLKHDEDIINAYNISIKQYQYEQEKILFSHNNNTVESSHLHNEMRKDLNFMYFDLEEFAEDLEDNFYEVNI